MRRRRRRWPWVLLAIVLLLPFGLRAALPLAVERGAAYGSRYWLGLPIRIDNVDLDLLGGVLVVEGLAVAAAPDAVQPFDAAWDPPALDRASCLLHLERIALGLSWADLREGRIHLSALTLAAPSVRVVRETDGTIDPLRHARPLAPPSEESEEETAESAEWPLAIDRFALSVPNVVVIDAAGGEELLAFSLEEFALEKVSSAGGQLALGGVGIQKPVLRVRRDLVLASPKAAGAAPAVDAAPPERAEPAPNDAVVAAAEPVAKPAPAQPASGDGVPPPESGTATTAAIDGKQAEAPAAPKAAATNAPAPGYRIEKIDIARATFTWVTDRGPLDVALALKASDISADEGKQFPIDLDLEIEKGRIGLEGNVGILPPSYSGKLEWSGLPFPPLLLASLPDLAAWLRSADSTGSLQVDADIAGTKGPPTIRMSGRSTIETLAVADPGDKELTVGWKQLEVVMKDVVVPLPEEGKPARTTVASFESIKLLEPKIRYTHPSPAVYALLGIPVAPPPAAAPKSPATEPTAAKAVAANASAEPIAKAASPKPAPAAATASKPAVAETAQEPPVDVTVASLALVAGDLELLDTTIAPPVTSTIRELNVSARDVHFPDPSARAITLKAILPKSSALEMKGDLRPGNNGDFRVTLKQLDLPVFSPYAQAAGAKLDAGQASLETKLELRGAVTRVDNALVLRKLGVSLQDPSSFDRSFGMPLDLALALLRDPAGDIRLNIPVTIDEKGAQVSVGAIIASALKAALVGAVTAPLKLLGAAFSGAAGGEGGASPLGIAPIGGLAGSAELAADAPSRADALARMLADRPSMALELRGRVSAADRPIVAERILIERLEADQGLPDLDGAGFLAKRRVSQELLARGRRASGKKTDPPKPLSPEDEALLQRYIENVKIPDARLDELARRRAENVQALLAARKIAGTRLLIGTREPDGDPAVVLSLRPN